MGFKFVLNIRFPLSTWIPFYWDLFKIVFPTMTANWKEPFFQRLFFDKSNDASVLIEMTNPLWIVGGRSIQIRKLLSICRRRVGLQLRLRIVFWTDAQPFQFPLYFFKTLHVFCFERVTHFSHWNNNFCKKILKCVYQ